ncbi:leucyl aminopeptidase [Acidobacteria bacterium AH-259-D05]|nr:leucyl aminopeptidase [Acidobacteria bacterium AH-259-D05]
MKIRLVKKNWDSIECDALIVPIFEDENNGDHFFSTLDEKLGGLLSELKSTEEWTSKASQISVIYRPNQLKTARLILLGVGPRESYDSHSIRTLIMKAVHKVKSYDLKRVAFYRRSQVEPKRAAQAAVEGVILATYEGDDYKTKDKSKNFIEEILFVTNEDMDIANVEAAMERGEILANATNVARRLVNEPGNRVNPSRLAQAATEMAAKYNLEVEVWDEPEMEEKEMGAILAVARGSDEPARFIILRYFGAPSSEAKPVVLVGKGVTFDSGGLSLKPAQSMEEMKADKAGACVVLAAMQAIAQIGVKKNIIGLIPAVENLPSGRAQRPGDVIRSMSGKTIEVINTDAEGRLILADALCYARQLQAEYIVDIATLTGACVIALGKIRAGLFSNNEELYEKLLRASEQSGEKFWRLPLDEEYRKEIESQIADMKNVGGRWGGAITAAKFLEEFVEDVPWCHLDIAGVDLFKDNAGIKGPTGFGVRTLVEMVSD